MAINKDFFVEMTDTFGGEANYCWVNRFKVRASTMRGAMLKVTRETGYTVRCAWDSGDVRRYDATRANICFFVEEWDDAMVDQYSSIRSI